MGRLDFLLFRKKKKDSSSSPPSSSKPAGNRVLREFTQGLVAGLVFQVGGAILAKVQEVLEQRRKRRLAGLETVVLEVHLKQGFDAWKRLFDEDGKNRAGICDESRTTCAKVSEDLALVTLHSVDMDKMQAFPSSPDFQKLIEPYVAKHVPYVCTPLN